MNRTLSSTPPRSMFPWSRGSFPVLREEMEDLLSRFWPDESREMFTSSLVPSADVSETDKSIEVRMDLPGMQADDIDIQIDHGVLTVRGERKEEREEKEKTFHRMERRIGHFARSLTLPCAVAEDDAVAEYKDGILNITMPKTVQEQSHKVHIRG